MTWKEKLINAERHAYRIYLSFATGGDKENKMLGDYINSNNFHERVAIVSIHFYRLACAEKRWRRLLDASNKAWDEANQH